MEASQKIQNSQASCGFSAFYPSPKEVEAGKSESEANGVYRLTVRTAQVYIQRPYIEKTKTKNKQKPQNRIST